MHARTRRTRSTAARQGSQLPWSRTSSRQQPSAPGAASDISSVELGIFGSSDARRQATETSSVLPLTTVTGTTDEHVDHLKAGAGPTVPTDDVVAFVFLNTNPDAHFELDGECVPVVKNNLVAFNRGHFKHRTVVNGGEVRLLGPFHAKSMEPVGGHPPPAPQSKSSKSPKTRK